MWTYLRRLWAALWGKQERRDVFEYFDGQQQRSIDPLVAYHAMIASDKGNVMTDLLDVQQGDWEAFERLQAVTREMFGVKPLAEGGLTMYETDDLLGRFFEYMDKLKKKRAVLSPSSPRTALNPSEPLTTKPAAESSGTPSESTAGAAT